MVSLQIISKVISSGDYRIIEDNLLTDEYFVGYTDELHFIKEHLDNYGNVPDKATFLAKFPNIELVEVAESDKYLVDTIREEYLYQKLVPVIQKSADICTQDSNEAVSYLLNAVKTLQLNYNLKGTDIISQAKDRFDEFVLRKDNQDESFFTCGFPELDDLTHGIQRGEELYVIFARTNQGKSWILEKMCTHVWQIGYNVGYISPEMSASSVGYRFDTLFKNYSNKGLMWGNGDVSQEDYEKYIEELATRNNKFIVSTPIDFDKKITVTKLKNWIQQYKLDMVAIDGITYMTDERYRRGDNKTTTLTNISEDLMGLSMELKVPILIVVQANRSGVGEDNKEGTPELESIRDSDGISHNASKVIAIRQIKEGILEIGIKKNRFGSVGGKLKYQWDIDNGSFVWCPNYEDAVNSSVAQEKVEIVKKQYNDKTEIFKWLDIEKHIIPYIT